VACVDHPEWVLPVDWSASHGLPPLEAVLTTDSGLEIRPYTAGFGAMISGRRDDPADRPHVGVALMQPESRGQVALVSADPDAPPIIEHRYDREPADVARLEAGTELARELAGATAQVGSVSWSTSQHLSSTAPMGVDGDAGAVVDTQCRVRGVDGLWVVDGSVLPAITSRGPHATIVMVGHRAVEFIV
jgi:choline dehydrogenase